MMLNDLDLYNKANQKKILNSIEKAIDETNLYSANKLKS